MDMKERFIGSWKYLTLSSVEFPHLITCWMNVNCVLVDRNSLKSQVFGFSNGEAYISGLEECLGLIQPMNFPGEFNSSKLATVRILQLKQNCIYKFFCFQTFKKWEKDL